MRRPLPKSKRSLPRRASSSIPKPRTPGRKTESASPPKTASDAGLKSFSNITPALRTSLEKVLWAQLEHANKQITFLQDRIATIIDSKYYRPVISPRGDVHNLVGDPHAHMLSDVDATPEEGDEAEVKINLKAAKKYVEDHPEWAREINEEIEEIAEEHAAAHVQS